MEFEGCSLVVVVTVQHGVVDFSYSIVPFLDPREKNNIAIMTQIWLVQRRQKCAPVQHTHTKSVKKEVVRCCYSLELIDTDR